MPEPPTTLRDYQAECVAAIRQPSPNGGACCSCCQPAAARPSCFAFITAHAAAKGNRVIVLAHRQEIADQISIALTAMGVPHGRIQPGHALTDDLVQVGMVQTVARRLEAIPAPALLVIDEATTPSPAPGPRSPPHGRTRRSSASPPHPSGWTVSGCATRSIRWWSGPTSAN